MAAFALIFVIPVMNRECQSDDRNDDNDDFVCSHGLITPFGNKEGQSQAPSVSFLPGAMLRHYSSTYVSVTSMHCPGIDFRLSLWYNDGKAVFPNGKTGWLRQLILTV